MASILLLAGTSARIAARSLYDGKRVLRILRISAQRYKKDDSVRREVMKQRSKTMKITIEERLWPGGPSE
jgi:hypothetical protein